MDITRRTFAKGALGTLAAFAAAGAASLAEPRVFRESAEAAETTEGAGEWKPSWCTYCHFPVCSTQVLVENGIAREVKGDPNGANKGRLCVRGLSSIGQLYSPYRVQAPMKRTNPEKAVDNDPGWVEISWDEALDTVAEKLVAAREYHPDSIVFSSGFGNEETFHNTPFFALLGTKNIVPTPGSLCPEHFNQLHCNGTILDRVDLEHAEYIVEIGRTMGSNFCATSAGHSAHYADAVERGVKFVTVNPVCNHSAQRGEWVPIMPGTDTAFGLALMNVMIHELGKYDEWWLKVRSNAPYLVGDQVKTIKGRECHKGGYVRDENGKPLVWDTQKKAPVPFDDSKGETYALLGAYEVNGVVYRTAFQVLADYVADKTPEWQEDITTISAEKVREIAGDLVKHAHFGDTITINGYEFPLRPSSVYVGRGMASHMLGISGGKVFGAINVMLGNLDVPGGLQACDNGSWVDPRADADGVLEPWEFMANQVTGGEGLIYPPNNVNMSSWYPMCHTNAVPMWKTINDMEGFGFDYEIQVMHCSGADPIASGAFSEVAVEAMKKIPFTFTVNSEYDLVSQFADIILAENATLEKDSMFRMYENEKECNDETRGLMGQLVRRPVVERVYNTMNTEDIQIALLERMGDLLQYNAMSCADWLKPIYPDFPELTGDLALDPAKKYTFREIIDRKILSYWGEEGLDHFDTCSFLPYELPLEQSYNYWYAPENQVRLPVYFERQSRTGELFMSQLEEHGVTVPNQDMEHVYSHYSNLPLWYEEDAGWTTTDEYPLKVVNWKIHYGTNRTGSLYENAALQEVIGEFNPTLRRIWIAPQVAQEYELHEDDLILVESRFAGSTEGKVHISQLIHPKCIGIPGNFGRRTGYMAPIEDEGVFYNSLVSLEERTINPISLGLESSPQVRISKIA